MPRLAAALALALAAIAVTLATAPAAFAQDGASCPEGFTCSTVTVPLSHADPSRGTLDLPVARHDASAGEGKPILLYFSGGPGGASIDQAPAVAERLAPALERYAFVVFDVRGTGATALRCPALQALGEYPELDDARSAFAACGAALGARAGDFQTEATVDDIEAVRTALGAERLAIYGVSYGTIVGQAYLLAHPERLDAIVLDSVGPVGALDPFWRSTFEAIPRVMRQQGGGIVAATRKLVRQLERRPLTGTVTGPDGEPRRMRLDAALDLYYLYLAGDNISAYRREYPAAVRAALQGDATPLLRMVAALKAGDVSPVEQISTGLYAATTCTDTPMPYALDADPATRPALVRQALAAIPDSAIRPFDRATMLGGSVAAPCERWPAVPLTPRTRPDGYAQVPALVVNGGSDIRTPNANARAVAARIPGAHLVLVRGTGHAVVQADASGCAADAANLVLLGGDDVPDCRDVDNGLDTALARMPVALRDFEPQPADGGRAGRAVAAVRATINDALAYAPPVQRGEAATIGGLRGGTAVVRRRADGTTAYTLRRYAYVPGLPVSGTIADRVGRLRSTGLIRGSLRFAPEALIGRFGGVTVRQPR